MFKGSNTQATQPRWGRRSHANHWTGLRAMALMLFCPILSVALTINMEQHQGDMRHILDKEPLYNFWQNMTLEHLVSMHQLIASYLVFQAVLYSILPGRYHTGQQTPGGQLLEYKTNGLLAFLVTCFCFWLGHVTGQYNASFIATDFSTLVVALNMWGLVLTLAAYVKANLWPSSLNDRVFTGNALYDICMGVELNPCLPIIDDVKLFVVGRVGMMIWPMVLFSFASLQYEQTGQVSNLMLVGVCLQLEYIADFFWNEHWYLRTIDVAHDHVGFYMIWGCSTWLPSTYTLHAQFMARNPDAGLGGNGSAAVCLIVGTAGYLLFRVANNQKYRVREQKGNCEEWGKPATYITARFATADGAEHEAILLTCGWWGVARHVNYVGDLVFSFATCATTGFGRLLPWFYAIYMSVLLLHRCFRDEARCQKKYGKDWQKYCDQVRWRLVPYLL